MKRSQKKAWKFVEMDVHAGTASRSRSCFAGSFSGEQPMLAVTEHLAHGQRQLKHGIMESNSTFSTWVHYCYKMNCPKDCETNAIPFEQIWKIWMNINALHTMSCQKAQPTWNMVICSDECPYWCCRPLGPALFSHLALQEENYLPQELKPSLPCWWVTLKLVFDALEQSLHCCRKIIWSTDVTEPANAVIRRPYM